MVVVNAQLFIISDYKKQRRTISFWIFEKADSFIENFVVLVLFIE